MAPLNALGFDITEDDLTLPADEPVYQAITVLYAPENRAAALTVAAAVPGAVMETQDDLGSQGPAAARHATTTARCTAVHGRRHGAAVAAVDRAQVEGSLVDRRTG